MDAVGVKLEQPPAIRSRPNRGFAAPSRDGGSYVISMKSRGGLKVRALEGSHSRNNTARLNVNGDRKVTTTTSQSCSSSMDPNSSNGHAGTDPSSQTQLSTIGNSTNIKWHGCPVEKVDRNKLLNQKGCVVWITGLSGSGKSTVACALSQKLYQRGKLSYILDGDNVRHGLNRDLSFQAEDRAENIRRVGEVAKLFADAGVICIACLISPYRHDRDACREMLPNGDFLEVFMDVPIQVCESRDPKGLYKLARAGKIKGFTGIDDPYEPPENPQITLKCNTGDCISPCDMADKLISYLEEKGYLYA